MAERYNTRKSSRPNGRGQLSSIDLLPEEADEAIAWANAQLRERSMPQQEILRQFNAQLADLGAAPITRSAFSRHSVRLAIELRKMEASRQLMDLVLSRMEPGESSDSTIAATELLKYRIMEQVMAEDEPDPKLLLNATLALQRLSATNAREAAVQRRDKLDQQEEAARAAEQAKREQADAEAAEKVDRIGKEAGLSAEHLASIRKGVLGLAG